MHTWNIGWGPVSWCNMNCRFCYSKTRREEMKDLGLSEWIKFIDSNAAKINTINYGTGENTLSGDWFRLIKCIRDNYPNIRQSLTTNGYISQAVLDENNLNAFLSAIDEVDVSLDFCDKGRHNDFRGQPCAYDWAISTLSLCKKNDIPSTIVFLGSCQNLFHDNIDGLFEIAKEYGSVLRMNIFRPTDGMTENAKEFIATRGQIIDAIEYINRKYSVISINDAYFAPLMTGKANRDPSGIDSIRILSDGSITPSTYLIQKEYVLANITDEDVLSKLENNSQLREVIFDALPEECKGCLLEKSCLGGVTDRRYLWHGSLLHRDPYCNSPIHIKTKPIVEENHDAFQSVHDGYLPTMFFRP